MRKAVVRIGKFKAISGRRGRRVSRSFFSYAGSVRLPQTCAMRKAARIAARGEVLCLAKCRASLSRAPRAAARGRTRAFLRRGLAPRGFARAARMRALLRRDALAQRVHDVDDIA